MCDKDGPAPRKGGSRQRPEAGPTYRTGSLPRLEARSDGSSGIVREKSRWRAGRRRVSVSDTGSVAGGGEGFPASSGRGRSVRGPDVG